MPKPKDNETASDCNCGSLEPKPGEKPIKDGTAADQILAAMKSGHYKFSSLIEAMVQSVPFQMRRGEGRKMVAK